MTPGNDLTGQWDPELLAAAFRDLPFAFGLFDHEMRYVAVNQRLAEMNGSSVAGLLGHTPSQLRGGLGARAEQLYDRVLVTGEPVSDVPLPGATRASDGGVGHHALHCFPVRLEGDERPGAVGLIVTDVTERALTRAELERTSELFELLIEGVSDYALTTLDADGVVTSCNVGSERIFGYRAEEMVGRHLSELQPANGDDGRSTALEQALAEADEQGRAELEGWRQRADGSRFYAHTVLTAIRDAEGLRGFAVVDRDVTERRRVERALRHQALHDPLTGLPNRLLLEDRIGKALARAERADEAIAILLIDLDRFKEINDVLGHGAGDRVLQEVATRLAAEIRGQDTVARLGGDEFAAMLVGLTGVDDAVATARRLLTRLRRPVPVGQVEFPLSASIGVMVVTDADTSVREMLRRADAAMYTAKRSGEGVAVHDPGDHSRPQRLELAVLLRDAIEAKDFRVVFQPKMRLSTLMTEELEAFVRWPGAPVGMARPRHFLPLAEEIGMALPLTRLVLAEVAQRLRLWREQGHQVRAAVNLSVRAFHHPELYDATVEALAAAHVEPDRLTLEITESALVANPVSADETLRRLRDLGVRLSLDDFGSGYSSLARLRHLPIDELKIDPSFVGDVAGDRGDARFVEAVVRLAHTLGLTVVAEGIEDRAVCREVTAMGCDLGQGYYLFRPAPPDAVAEVLPTG